jgi:hypothetical protein
MVQCGTRKPLLIALTVEGNSHAQSRPLQGTAPRHTVTRLTN